MASMALSMRFVHTWFSSPGIASMRGGRAVVAHDRDVLSELVREHHEVLSMPRRRW